MVGAPLLTAKAVLRIGAGLVTIAAQADVIQAITGKFPEAITLRLPKHTEDATQALDTYCRSRKVTCLAIGPGLTTKDATLVRKLCYTISLPIVLDAGAIAAFAGHLPELAACSAKNTGIILTPHMGEYQTLVSQQIAGDFSAHAKHFAKKYGVYLVLKGHDSTLFSPKTDPIHNKTGNPGLATAGTGDVLTGIIAGLLAQGLPIVQAAQSAIYIHGLAGDIATMAKTEPGIIASDVIDALPLALKQIEKQYVIT